MNILYLSLSYIPSRRASSVQVMRMCEAFAAVGHSVTLVGKRPEADATLAPDPFAFYGVRRTFELDLVARPPRRGGGLVYAVGVVRHVLAARRDVDLVYSRDLLGGWIATELGLPTAYEAHGVFDREWQRGLWRRMVNAPSFRGLVPISNAMIGELERVDLLPRARPIVVAHSPASRPAACGARAACATPPRIAYVGSIYPGRGIELVLRVAKRMPGCTFHIIGGSDSEVERWRTGEVPTNVTFRGFCAPATLPALYRDMDVLLMPYPHAGIHGATRRLDTAKYCSPMKMFEYMAAGVPIVASDLPVLQEVLVDGRNALIAAANDDVAWARAIDRLLHDRALRVALAETAFADLAEFTPEARVSRILAGLAPTGSNRPGSRTAPGRSTAA